jgi:hypothetical protein
MLCRSSHRDILDLHARLGSLKTYTTLINELKFITDTEQVFDLVYEKVEQCEKFIHSNAFVDKAQLGKIDELFTNLERLLEEDEIRQNICKQVFYDSSCLLVQNKGQNKLIDLLEKQNKELKAARIKFETSLDSFMLSMSKIELSPSSPLLTWSYWFGNGVWAYLILCNAATVFSTLFSCFHLTLQIILVGLGVGGILWFQETFTKYLLHKRMPYRSFFAKGAITSFILLYILGLNVISSGDTFKDLDDVVVKGGFKVFCELMKDSFVFFLVCSSLVSKLTSKKSILVRWGALFLVGQLAYNPNCLFVKEMLVGCTVLFCNIVKVGLGESVETIHNPWCMYFIETYLDGKIDKSLSMSKLVFGLWTEMYEIVLLLSGGVGKAQEILKGWWFSTETLKDTFFSPKPLLGHAAPIKTYFETAETFGLRMKEYESLKSVHEKLLDEWSKISILELPNLLTTLKNMGEAFEEWRVNNFVCQCTLNLLLSLDFGLTIKGFAHFQVLWNCILEPLIAPIKPFFSWLRIVLFYHSVTRVDQARISLILLRLNNKRMVKRV